MRALVFVLAMFAAVSPAFAAEQRMFRDWRALCRNDGYCSAAAYLNPNPGGGVVADYIFRIGRHAEQSYWEMSCTPVATMADEWSEFVFTVEGQPTTFSPRSEIGAYGSINEFFLLGDKAQAVMDALMPASSLTIDFTTSGGSLSTQTFSLSGLTAALLWIDEQQHRIGSERVTSVPPYGLTPTGAEQDTTAQVPIDLLDRRRADLECRLLEQISNGRDFESADLGEGHTLYILPCDSFAYNFSSQVYVFDGDEYRQQYFADFSQSTGWTGTPVLFLPGYDPTTKTLTSFYKGRGIGDCGTSGTWLWTGSMFEMTEYRSKDECDGEDGDWPVVFERQTSTAATTAR